MYCYRSLLTINQTHLNVQDPLCFQGAWSSIYPSALSVTLGGSHPPLGAGVKKDGPTEQVPVSTTYILEIIVVEVEGVNMLKNRNLGVP